MTTNPFATPAAPSSGIRWADFEGRLLVIEPLSDEKGIQTSFGEADAVKANIYAIDGTPEEFPDSLVFPKILASQLRPRLGQKVIGRLGKGQAKPSQSPPWLLQDASPQDIETGAAWLAARQSGQFAQPAQQAPAQPQVAAGSPPF